MGCSAVDLSVFDYTYISLLLLFSIAIYFFIIDESIGIDSLGSIGINFEHR